MYVIHINNVFNLNLVIKADNDHPNSPKLCISDTYILNGYVFIENTDKNCLLQFRENYWQH